MPLATEFRAAEDFLPIEAVRERRLVRGSVADRRPRIEIGLVNNMPDAAFAATQRQFSRLLAAASDHFDVRLRLLGLDGVPRSAAMRERLAGVYDDASALYRGRLDAVIVTGAEPIAPELADEPYWTAFGELIDWAQSNTISTVLSCLAAHAGVLRLDGIARRRLPAKCSGVFTFEPAQGSPLAAGLGATLIAPHSRRNGLSQEDLTRQGYQILASNLEVGVDAFVKQAQSLLVFLQGHLEYDADSLAREYRRDILRFLRGEQDWPPSVPVAYYPLEVERALIAFAERAHADRRPELMESFPEAGGLGPSEPPWRASAVRFYRNWLALVAERKPATADGPIAVARWGG